MKCDLIAVCFNSCFSPVPVFRVFSQVVQAMMQESGTEATSNGLANQNGGASVEGGAKTATPSVEVTAADLLHLQQHQVPPPYFRTCLCFIKTCQQQASSPLLKCHLIFNPTSKYIEYINTLLLLFMYIQALFEYLKKQKCSLCVVVFGCVYRGMRHLHFGEIFIADIF